MLGKGKVIGFMLESGFVGKMNEMGSSGVPFLFIIDFDGVKPLIWPLSELPGGIRFQTPFHSYHSEKTLPTPPPFHIVKTPPDPGSYRKAFDKVQYHLHRGDTYLINLTMPTKIECNYSEAELFENFKATYKLLLPGQFICFSPEIFVRINNGSVSSFPMKGTIDAAVDDAEKKLLSDEKEIAEHNTIIDLIRNDLNMVAKNVKLARYRYIDRIKTNERDLLQVSSEITGELPADYKHKLGDIFNCLLPAGSISGAPKEKTVEIIKEAENYERGYYTGVFGVFDGRNLDSAVMIRFVDLQNNRMIFKSGGGITAKSQWQSEYEELIHKVYVPLA